MAEGLARTPAALVGVIREEASVAMPVRFKELADRVQAECGTAVEAILLYGSCLRTNDAAAGVVDLFVIVGEYRGLRGGWTRRVSNAFLPPNVYFFEHGGSAAPVLRCKYAVISLEDFEAGMRAWLQPYIWARFAQASRLLFAKDMAMHDRICRALASAVVSFLRNVVPAMPTAAFTTPEIWRQGLALTYGVELRPEATDRPDLLATADGGYFERVTVAAATALADLASPAGTDAWHLVARVSERRACRQRWRMRRLLGPILSLLRWIKAAFTFSGGVDYAAWKIERHTGVRTEVTERLRRHPLLYGWPILWKLWRSGTLR